MSDSHTTNPDETPVDTKYGDDLPIVTLVVSSVCTVIITLVLILLLQALYGWYDQKLAEEKNTPAPRDTAAADTLASNPAWVNKEEQIVSMPIDHAMQVVVERYGQPTETESSEADNPETENPETENDE